MKKIVIVLLGTMLLLSGCKKTQDTKSKLEEVVRKFDKYAVLADYQYGYEDKEGIKIVAAYDVSKSDIYYIIKIYPDYQKNISVSVYVDDNLYINKIFRDINDEEIIVLRGNEIPDGELLEFDFGGVLFKDYSHKIKLVKSADQINNFKVLFKDASTYQEKEVKRISELNNGVDFTLVFFVIFLCGVFVYMIVVNIHKFIYTRNTKLDINNVNGKKGFMKYTKFKVYTITIIFIISIISFGVICVREYNYLKYLESKFNYVEGSLFQEEVTGINEEIKMKVSIPDSLSDYQTIIFEKPSGGGVHFQYIISFNDDEENQVTIKMGSCGGLEYKEVFKDINYNTMTIKVYDFFNEETVLTRKYMLKDY